MGLTPLLGDLAASLSEPLIRLKEDGTETTVSPESQAVVAKDSIVVCGYGEIGQAVLTVLGKWEKNLLEVIGCELVENRAPRIVAFDTDPSLARAVLRPDNRTVVLFGNGGNGEVIRSSGIHNPSCFFVTHESYNRVLSSTARLRASFPDTPIYVRASTRFEAQSLKAVGATEVVVESDELPKSALELVRGAWNDELSVDGRRIDEFDSEDQLLSAAAAAAGVSLSEAARLVEIYKSMDRDGSCQVSPMDVDAVLRRSSYWIASDTEIHELDEWINKALKNVEVVSVMDLCRLYGRAPRFVRKAFGIESEII